MMFVKIHIDENGNKIVAVCDENIIGKKFIEGNRQLDLSSDFYRGQKKTKEEVTYMLNDAYIINLAGKESVNLAIGLGLIVRENITTIAKVEHAQAVIIREG